jgi:hypothetical protein
VFEKLVPMRLCIIYLLDRVLEENQYLINFFSCNVSSSISTNGNNSHVLHEVTMQLIYYDSKLKLVKNASNEHILMLNMIS